MTAPYLRVISTPALQETVREYRRQSHGLAMCSLPSSVYLHHQIIRGLEVIESEISRRIGLEEAA